MVQQHPGLGPGLSQTDPEPGPEEIPSRARSQARVGRTALRALTSFLAKTRMLVGLSYIGCRSSRRSRAEKLQLISMDFESQARPMAKNDLLARVMGLGGHVLAGQDTKTETNRRPSRRCRGDAAGDAGRQIDGE